MDHSPQQRDSFDLITNKLSVRHLSGKEEPVDAVVAVLLRKETDSDLSVLLIHRAERANDPWSGQIGLPGGRVSSSDTSSRGAVRREVIEEIGVDLDQSGKELGTMSISSPMRVLNMRVQPWVYALTSAPKLSIGSEVQGTFWAEVSQLPSLRTTTEIEFRGTVRAVDAFLVDGHVVWGYTHRVLNELLSVLSADI